MSRRPVTVNIQPAQPRDAGADRRAFMADGPTSPAVCLWRMRYRPGLLVGFLAKILLGTKFATIAVFRGLMLSAPAVWRALQIAEHLSAHHSETVSSRDVMIIPYQLSVR
jgi:hypothetical protein